MGRLNRRRDSIEAFGGDPEAANIRAHELATFGALGWEGPQPLPSVSVPDFPMTSLPPVLRAYVEGLATETQTPTDMAAMVVLGIVATAGAKRADVEVRDGWREPINIFSITAMGPGNRKSGVFRDAARPLVEFEVDEARRLAGEVKRSESSRRVAEKALELAIGRAAKCDAKDKTECDRAVARLTDELEALPIVTSPRLWGDDTTEEKLSMMLSQNFGRIGILSAEGGLFAAIAGRYRSNGAPSMEVLLKGHAGDDIAVDRVTRPTVRIHNPALTICITVQPDVLRSCAATPEFRGRGLMARFLFAAPTSIVGRRITSPPPCPDEARRAYYAVIRRIIGIEPSQAEDGGPVPHTLKLDPDALAELLTFVDWLEPQLGENGGLHSIADWGAKLAGAVVRIAGLLHVVESPVSKPISVETITRAITIGRYLIPHAQAAFQWMGEDEGNEDARALLAWIRKNPRPFTKRDVFNGLRSRFQSADRADRPLALLVELHHIREIPQDDLGRPGRPPSPKYEINPATLSHNTHNTHNPARRSREPSSADCAYSAPTPEPETTSERETADIRETPSAPARIVNKDADDPGATEIEEIW